MSTSLADLRARVVAQKTLIPSLYGGIDFDITPERFADHIDDECSLPEKFSRKYRAAVLADKERLERARAYTMRSEERRVGKECRSRWSPCHERKKCVKLRER